MDKYINSIREIQNYVLKNYPDLIITNVDNTLIIKSPNYLSNHVYDLPIPKSIDLLNKDKEELKYLNEFNLLSSKSVHKMEDFTIEELKMWKIILTEIYSEWAEIDNIDGDLFDKENIEIYEREIRIEKWIWKNNNKTIILTDIYGFPGDTESGAIFMNGKLVLINSDQEISSTDLTSKELMQRIPSFSHVRLQQCIQDKHEDPNINVHKHCIDIREKMS